MLHRLAHSSHLSVINEGPARPQGPPRRRGCARMIRCTARSDLMRQAALELRSHRPGPAPMGAARPPPRAPPPGWPSHAKAAATDGRGQLAAAANKLARRAAGSSGAPHAAGAWRVPRLPLRPCQRCERSTAATAGVQNRVVSGFEWICAHPRVAAGRHSFHRVRLSTDAAASSFPCTRMLDPLRPAPNTPSAYRRRQLQRILSACKV